MLPHPDTILFIIETQHQERLRDAANDRLAASAQVHQQSRFTRLTEAAFALLAWRGQLRPRMRRATRPGIARPVA
jgi:hypothetical protein